MRRLRGVAPWLREGASVTTVTERPTCEQIYREHWNRLTRLTSGLARRVGLPDPDRDAEDLVQDAFEAALRSWADVDDPAAWLYSVASNKVKAASRKAQGTAAVSLNDIDDHDRPRWTSSALRPTAEEVHLCRRAMTAIAQLPDRQRAVLFLNLVHGWPADEIAALFGCTRDTVNVHKLRARNRVQSTIGVWAYAVPSGAVRAGFLLRRTTLDAAMRELRGMGVNADLLERLRDLYGLADLASRVRTPQGREPRDLAEIRKMAKALLDQSVAAVTPQPVTEPTASYPYRSISSRYRREDDREGTS